MLVVVVASTQAEAVVVAQNIISEGGNKLVTYYEDYMQTTGGDTFICMCPANLMCKAVNLRADVVFVTEAAYDATNNDTIISDTIVDMSRLGPALIIVNDDPDLLVD